jgi:hypothetical protein
MSIAIRHFVASGLTTVLLFGVVERFPEQFVNRSVGHPTASDMVAFLFAALLCSATIVALIMFPQAWFAERYIARRISTVSKALLVLLPFLGFLFAAGSAAAILHFSGLGLLSICLIVVCIPLAPFCFYWGLLWLLRVFVGGISNRPNKTPEPTPGGAGSSASRSTVFGPAWLSFFRWPS